MLIASIFDPFFDAIAGALAWLYALTDNYALAIMLLTLGIMILLTPLTLKGTRSMIAMQRLQPEIRKLQNRYKDDRQKLNEEMLKFYKENDLNPVGGCMPLLLQAPVFLVLYRVLLGLTNPAPFGQDMGRAVAMAAKQPGAVYPDFGTFDPGYLNPDTLMYQDLHVSREMMAFGIDLSRAASQAFGDGLVAALPYLVLIAIIGVTAWYQQKQIQARNPQGQAQINPQQQMIMKVLPYFLPIISLTLPAGVVLYFLVSNLYRIGQQAFITRTMYNSHEAKAIETTATEQAAPKMTWPKIGSGKGSSSPPKGGTAPKGGSGGKAGGKASGTPASTAGNGGGARPKAPSRSAPAPNPNRSKSKKKRK